MISLLWSGALSRGAVLPFSVCWKVPPGRSVLFGRHEVVTVDHPVTVTAASDAGCGVARGQVYLMGGRPLSLGACSLSGPVLFTGPPFPDRFCNQPPSIRPVSAAHTL